MPTKLSITPLLDTERHTIPRHDGSFLNYYQCSSPGHITRPKSVVILLHGSGCDSVFADCRGGIVSPFLFGSLQKRVDRWHIICVEKRGVDFGQWTGSRGFGDECGQEYVEHATREDRADDVCLAIDDLISRDIHDGSELLLVGHSEGSLVASRCAAMSCSPTHVALFPFPAAFGLSGFLLPLEEQLKVGKISEDEFYQTYDDIVARFRAIRDDPQSVDEQFAGHSYRWWASYSFGQPLADLLAVSIPIFVGVGSLDRPGSTYNTVAEFVNQGKNNLTCRTYLGCDHGLYHGRKEDPRKATASADLVHGFVRREDAVSYQDKAFDDIVEWMRLE